MADELSVLDRRPAPRVALVPLYVVALLVILGLVAAFVVEVDETVLARGRLTPPGEGTRVMTLAGGRVAQVAAEGAVVAAGDVILALETPEATQAIATLEAQVASAREEVERHQAMGRAHAELAALQRDEVRVAREAQAAGLAGVQADSRRAATDLAVQDARLARTRALADTGDSAAEQLEESRREREAARAGLARVRAELTGGRKLLEGLEKKEERAQTEGRLAALATEVALLQARDDLAERLGQLARARLALEQAQVRAPVAGTLYAVAVRGPGEVVAAGTLVARIVPEAGELEAWFDVPASRMARLQAGAPARLELDAFPFADHGALPAEVVFVSPDATSTEGGLASYRVRARVARTGAWERLPLRPGMTLTARVQTGAPEPLGLWLLRPVRGAWRAATER
ncbi:MAG: HlyD family efflux transporter periplasmic adaptor subunit [Myxococcales bacterium]|nr:HlyD family efflux transporter periplasmic adaptor subunit [Myxococcales bacterium]